MKIVINTCFGSFGLSKKAMKFILDRVPDRHNNINVKYSFCKNRTAPELIECVEALGKQANGMFANLKVIEIPDDIEYSIAEVGGREWIAEKHRTWNENGMGWSTNE